MVLITILKKNRLTKTNRFYFSIDTRRGEGLETPSPRLVSMHSVITSTRICRENGRDQIRQSHDLIFVKFCPKSNMVVSMMAQAGECQTGFHLLKNTLSSVLTDKGFDIPLKEPKKDAYVLRNF